MIVLDASVLIAHLDAEDAHHERAVRLLRESLDEPLSANVVTVAEVLVGPTRAGRADIALEALAALELERIALPADMASALAALRVATGLRMPDCCVLWSAEVTGADVATFDDRLAAATRARGTAVRPA